MSLRLPRLKLQHKAFFALAVLLVALLLVFLGFSRLGLQRGLGPYMAEVELTGMDGLAERLAQHHAQNGGWDAARAQPGFWRDMVRPGAGAGWRTPAGEPGPRPPMPQDGRGPGSGPGPGPGPGNDFGPGDGFGPGPGPGLPPPGADRPGPPPDRPFGGPWARLGLLDAQGRLVAGMAPQAGAAHRVLRAGDGKAIGEIVLSPVQNVGNMQSDLDRAFLAQQMGFVAWTGLAGLLLALLLSAWLARRWLEPLTAFVDGLRGIAAGRMETRVAIKGDAELARLAETFNDMAVQLATMEASRQRWLADVAHELRTPLSTMRAEVEAVQDGVLPLDGRMAQRLHRQIMRLIRLVSDLRVSLDDPQALHGSGHVPVHPLALLGEALDGARPGFEQVGIGLDRSTVDQLAAQVPAPLVQGDPHRLHQVFANLLENSLRYTTAGGRLEVAAELVQVQGRSMLQLRWDDTAPGVGDQHLPRLFDRLYRVDASRVREGDGLGGSGLGLAICRTIIQAHGGSIEAAASPLGGLRITLWLPMLAHPVP
jgi:two-component system sensor histidine kinase BaeS